MWRGKDSPEPDAREDSLAPQVMARIEGNPAHLRILIADDHAVMREMLRGMLESQAGWEICGEAANGREAVDLALQLKPDLVTLDLSMPVMNGIEAAQELRRRLPKVPLVVITMFKTPHLEEQALNAGANVVLAKSEPRDIIENIRVLAGLRARSSQAQNG